MFCVRCLLSFSPAHTQTLVGILPLLTHRTIEEHALNLATYGRGLQCQDSVYALQVEYEGDCTWKILCKCKSICIKQLWTRSTSSDKNVKPLMLALYLEYTKQYHRRIAECIWQMLSRRYPPVVHALLCCVHKISHHWGEPERAPHQRDFIAPVRVYVCLQYLI